MTPWRQKADAAAAQFQWDQHTYGIELTTSHGVMQLALRYDLAPEHCKSMAGLVASGFYDGLTFHRIVPGFVIQGGCPEGTGTGGPGYTLPAEFNDAAHDEGVLSMARAADPDSAGSQFFVCLDRVAYLDGQYTVFGKATDSASLDTLRRIGAVTTDSRDHPEEPVTITAARVITL